MSVLVSCPLTRKFWFDIYGCLVRLPANKSRVPIFFSSKNDSKVVRSTPEVSFNTRGKPNQDGALLGVTSGSFRNSSSVDTPLSKINRSTYQGLSNKTSEGTPTQYFVQRFIDKVTVTLYLTPGSSQAGHKVNYYYVKRIQDVGDYTNATDVPYRFVPCMASGLSYYLSQKFKPELTQNMKLMYEDELQRALAEDGSSSSSFITPKTYYPGT